MPAKKKDSNSKPITWFEILQVYTIEKGSGGSDHWKLGPEVEAIEFALQGDHKIRAAGDDVFLDVSSPPFLRVVTNRLSKYFRLNEVVQLTVTIKNTSEAPKVILGRVEKRTKKWMF